MDNLNETYGSSLNRRLRRKMRIIQAASGHIKADLVLKNATYLNVFSNELCQGDIAVAEKTIVGIGQYDGETEIDVSGKIVLPGFMDAHIHLESALVTPVEFARAVLPHGTTAVVTDPHEITNVLGTDGIDYILQATEGLPVHVRLMLPSCVPATPLDESGANLDYHAITPYFDHPRVKGLAELMNYPGVIGGDRAVVEKIVATQMHHRKIDGHAPGLTGKELNTYVAAGVYSDHECSDLDDALRKLRAGQYIMIREGTAARNLEALVGLLQPRYIDRVMFCTDDRHPNDLLEQGHIDDICRKAVALGADPILVAKAASHNAARYFQINDRGAIAPGYWADLAVVNDLKEFRVEKTFCGGKLYYDGKVCDFAAPEIDPYLQECAADTFHVRPLTVEDLREERPRGVIGMVAGEIITTDNGYAERVDLDKDILKIAVVERHKDTGHIGTGYLQGYGLKKGAVATSISHDSHNIIVVGTNSQDMVLAANRIADIHGGIVVVADGKILSEVPLEIGGIMSSEPLAEVNRKLEDAKQAAHTLGVSEAVDPFMTLSFMALPVIPQVRITTRGVLDVQTQRYI